MALLVLGAWTLSDALLLTFAALLVAILLRRGGEAIACLTPLPAKAGVMVIVGLLAGLIYLFVRTLGPRIGREFTRILDVFPSSFETAERWLADRAWGRLMIDAIPVNRENGIDFNIFGTIGGTLTTAIGIGTGIVLLVSVSIFLALDPKLYRMGLLHLVAPARRGRAGEVLDALDRNLWRWLLGQMVDMAAVAILTGVGLWLAGVPLAITLGLIAGVTNFIPFIGPFLSAVPAVAIAFADDQQKALWALGIFVAVQQFEGNVLMPIIQKRAVALPPVLSILAIVAFGALFGFLGIVVATPLLLVVIVLVRMLYVEDVLGDTGLVGSRNDTGATGDRT
ncbi:AI-2E family transporter [Limimaricola sp. ASW11-118]|uniref:AI-2E family transporter n=1 Tax=Limimaricola litoreus TaxID=2955316 RepID=A0A9X2JN57_9RHOB|nr:AI-2E family transporter [Limimaricola litoreus]